MMDFFAKLIPEKYRKEIGHFISKPAGQSAWMPRKDQDSLKSFILTLPMDGLLKKAPRKDEHLDTLGYPSFLYTLIHEFGHYITKNDQQVYLQGSYHYEKPKPGSFIEKYLIFHGLLRKESKRNRKK